MGKKLITNRNYTEYISENKFFATSEMILTSAVKDELRSKGIEVVYVKCECEIKEKKCKSLEEEIVTMLVKKFGITDAETIKNIVLKTKEALKGE